MVDAAFGELIRRAYAHHADLLKFGGDAILLLFRGEDHAQRAAAAAVGMQEALAGHATALDLGRARPAADVDRRAQRRVPLLPRRRHPPRADRRRRGRDDVRRDRGDRAARARSRSAPRRRGSSTRACSARAATAPCCSRTAPDVPEVVPAVLRSTRASISSQLLPAAYTRELRGEPADPEHRHVAIAFVELRGTDELLEREGPEALAEALEESITAIQESCLALRRHVRADGREQGGRQGDPPRRRAAHRGRRGGGADAARDARDRRAAGSAAACASASTPGACSPGSSAR